MIEVFESAYLALDPNARFVGVTAGYRLWHSAASTPMHRFDSILAIHSTHTLSVRVRDGFDIAAVQAILTHVAPVGPSILPLSVLTVRPNLCLAGYSFDTSVVVPPRIARLFEAQSPVLKRASWWILPGYASEFVSGDTGATFWFALRSGGVEVIDWQRSVTPVVRARLLSPWPGGMLRFSRKPILLGYASLEHIVPALPAGNRGLCLTGSLGALLVRRIEPATFEIVDESASPQGAAFRVDSPGVVQAVQAILLGGARPPRVGA